MAQNSLEPGEAGAYRFEAEASGKVTAKCRYRNHQGKREDVERVGVNIAAATRALDKAIKARQESSSRKRKELTPDSFVREAVDIYWNEIKNHFKSPNTMRLYRSLIRRFILPQIGDLRIRQCSVGIIDGFLNDLYDEKGYSTYKTTRTITSCVFGVICRRDALTSNPVRDTARITAVSKPVNALKIDQIKELRKKLAQDKQAINRDLPDFVDFMLGTGVRISEAAAIVPECLVDLPYVDIVGMIIREEGIGLRIKDVPNSKLTLRRLELPPTCVKMLERRLTNTEPGAPIFPAPKGGLRDPSNTQADLREAFEKAGFRTETLKLTSHMFRKSVATEMDRADKEKGIKHQLGHKSEHMRRKYVVDNPDTGAQAVTQQFFDD